MIKKRYYSYEMFEKDVKKITEKIKNLPEVFDNIYAQPRNGLILGVRLSYMTGLPLILDKKYINKNTMIVDSVIDTGKTLHEYKNYFIVCLHWKHHASFKPSILCHKTKDYVVYDWERGEK